MRLLLLLVIQFHILVLIDEIINDFAAGSNALQ